MNKEQFPIPTLLPKETGFQPLGFLPCWGIEDGHPWSPKITLVAAHRVAR